jgi:hypothetical protein
MKDIIEITEELAGLQPGARIKVTGYVPSKGAPRDYDLELLPPDGYRRMQKEALAELSSPSLNMDRLHLLGEAAEGGVLSLINTIRKSLETPPAATRGGPAYERIKDGSLYTLPSKPGAVYLQRLLRLGDRPEEESKSALSGAAAVLQLLDLPLGRYIHVLQFADGKFDAVEVL